MRWIAPGGLLLALAMAGQPASLQSLEGRPPRLDAGTGGHHPWD